MFDDLDVYLADFGVPCVVTTHTFLGILNQPDDAMQFDAAIVQSNIRELTVKTSDISAASIGVKTSISIDGASYEVRSLEEPDDAAFTTLRVRKL